MKHLEAGLAPQKRTPYSPVLAVCLLLAVACTSRVCLPLGSRTADTTYVGYRDRAHQQTKYLGIPYARPPLGKLRFRPPLPYAPERDTSHADASIRTAYAFGPSCPQSTVVPYPVSEDCLTLNVWVPDVPKSIENSLGEEIAQGLPVLVWIYGGAFINGSTQKYPADGLVEASVQLGKPVIVASMNYRLGMFGFPVGAEPAASGAHNLGLLDQRLALEWVHHNIKKFGGDPEKITIFGESTGSVSVGAQMSYRGGNTGGIFRGAIMQSGAPSTMATSILAYQTRQATYDRIARYLSCPVPSGAGPESLLRESFECVRRADSIDLQRAEWEVLRVPDELKATDPAPIAFAPSIYPNDPFFFDKPDKIAEDHKFVNVPLIIGGTLDEGTDFVPSLSTVHDLYAYFTQACPGLTFGVETPSARKALETFVSLYSDDPAMGSPYGTGNETWGKGRETKRAAAIFGDWLFEAPRRKFTREAAKAALPVWSYQFSQPGFWPPEFGVGHFADVQMIFRWFDESSPREMVELSNTILRYWLNFVYYLDPNPKDARLPEWPQYGSGARSLQLKIGNFTVIKDDFRADSIEWLMKEKQLYL